MGTDLVPFEKYEIAGIQPQALIEAVEANLGGQKLSPQDLDTIKMPSGGGTFWAVPDLEGERPEKTIQGVIVMHQGVRAFWKTSIDDGGGGTPPDCHSPDLEWGYGDPGDGLRSQGRGCESCPMAQFGTADGGEGPGQACTQSHLLFLIQPEDMLPVVVRLSPTSLKPARQFLMRLSSKAVPYYRVVVELGLEPARSQGGQDYAKATFKVVGRLNPEEGKRVKDLGDAFAPLFQQAAAEQARAASGQPGADDEDPPAEAANAPKPSNGGNGGAASA